jgi:hypothetical protein
MVRLCLTVAVGVLRGFSRLKVSVPEVRVTPGCSVGHRRVAPEGTPNFAPRWAAAARYARR